MRKLGVVEFVTLDGVMQGFHDNEEDRAAGFRHCGWGMPYADAAQVDAAVKDLPQTTAYLLGRRTYQQMIRFWPTQPDGNPMAAHLNRTPKHVATRTLGELTWSNAMVLGGNLPDDVAALKAAGTGYITALGSRTVVRALIAAGLVDEFRLFVHPLLLGEGDRLFDDLSRPARLRLLDSTTSRTGVVMLHYAAG